MAVDSFSTAGPSDSPPGAPADESRNQARAGRAETSTGTTNEPVRDFAEALSEHRTRKERDQGGPSAAGAAARSRDPELRTSANEQADVATPAARRSIEDLVHDVVEPIREKLVRPAAIATVTGIAFVSTWNTNNPVDLPGENGQPTGGRSENQPALSVTADTRAELTAESPDDRSSDVDEFGPVVERPGEAPLDTAVLVTGAGARALEKPIEDAGEAAGKKRNDEQDGESARRAAAGATEHGEERPDDGEQPGDGPSVAGPAAGSLDGLRVIWPDLPQR